MSQKKTIFVTVLGGVADVDTATVPECLEVEIVDLDELKESGTDYIKNLSVRAHSCFKPTGFVDFEPLPTLISASSQRSVIFVFLLKRDVNQFQGARR
jgi:hypothetical protein